MREVWVMFCGDKASNIEESVRGFAHELKAKVVTFAEFEKMLEDSMEYRVVIDRPSRQEWDSITKLSETDGAIIHRMRGTFSGQYLNCRVPEISWEEVPA